MLPAISPTSSPQNMYIIPPDLIYLEELMSRRPSSSAIDAFVETLFPLPPAMAIFVDAFSHHQVLKCARDAFQFLSSLRLLVYLPDVCFQSRPSAPKGDLMWIVPFAPRFAGADTNIACSGSIFQQNALIELFSQPGTRHLRFTAGPSHTPPCSSHRSRVTTPPRRPRRVSAFLYTPRSPHFTATDRLLIMPVAIVSIARRSFSRPPYI